MTNGTKSDDTVRNLLTDEEHRAARASVSNAHYTSPLVVEAMWYGLEQLGLEAGARILEPSIGTGNFFGLMPENLMRKSLHAGVEIDSIMARLAKTLYPDATIFEVGFQDAPFPDNFFDIAVGNVPFGNYGVHDAAYKNWQTSSIHNYFFVKTLDKLRDGGVMALITSRFTMDEGEGKIRDYLASKADFLARYVCPTHLLRTTPEQSLRPTLLFAETPRRAGAWGRGMAVSRRVQIAGKRRASFDKRIFCRSPEHDARYYEVRASPIWDAAGTCRRN